MVFVAIFKSVMFTVAPNFTASKTLILFIYSHKTVEFLTKEAGEFFIRFIFLKEV